MIGIEVFTFTTMSKMKSTESEGPGDAAAAKLIDARIKELGDWHGALLARVRALIKQADAEVVEEWKWCGVPVWSHAGMICAGETYKSVVKLTFAKGGRWRIPRASSTPVWKATCCARLIGRRAKRLMRRR